LVYRVAASLAQCAAFKGISVSTPFAVAKGAERCVERVAQPLAGAAQEEKQMKSLFRSIVLAVGMLALAGVHNASAQIDNTVEFTTSFAFTVGNTTVPAGSYTIAPADGEDPKVLELKGGRTSVLFETESAQAKQTPSKTEVVFSRYVNGYVLKNIWVDGSDTGYVTENALGERHISKRGGSSSEHRIAARKTAKSPK
jgi:hypothetical protein